MLQGKLRDESDDSLFRLAMVSSGIGMAILDTEGRWMDVNPAFERMFGRPAAELIGRPVAEVTHPDDLAMSRAYLAGLVSGDVEALDAQKRYLRSDGSTLWAHVNVAAMKDADGRALYLIVQLRDITAQRDAERALQELNESLEQRVAERTATLETVNRQQELFAYGISHDLRAPLRAIDGFATLLSNHEAAHDDTARDYIHRIRGATRRMGELIDALLELSRASRAALREQTVDLSLLAEWSLAELADADPGRASELVVQPGLQVRGDERQLKSLLDHVLHNAWKFSRERDRVAISVQGTHHDDRVHITIRDAGIGFDTRYVEKMFEPFQRLHGPEQAGGNGIGLAIAQRIVERHGGKLWAESETGLGSTFHIELDAPADDEPVATPDAS